MQANGAADFVSIRENLARLSPSPPECCIFRVHEELRRVNEKSYDPVIIAIGPYHNGKDGLKMMEEHKLRYLQSLLQGQESTADRYIMALRPLENKARKCYSEPLDLTPDRFTEMMVLDGCFIIEFIRKFYTPRLRDSKDPIFEMDWMIVRVLRDLILMENQLPFFVLSKLLELTEGPDQHQRFITRAFELFRDLTEFPQLEGNLNAEIGHEHLLGLVHYNWLPPSLRGKGKIIDVTDRHRMRLSIPCTKELQEAGVKFKKGGEGSLFDINFENGVMHIPPLTVEDRTESFLRNLVAYEQYLPGDEVWHVTDYVKFMDCLINSPKDVEILSSHEILLNHLGSDEVVANMFNRITDSVTVHSDGRPLQYADIFDNVNIHCGKRRNRWMAKLRRNYLNSPWAVLSIVAASVLLLLTVMQTFFTIFPRK